MAEASSGNIPKESSVSLNGAAGADNYSGDVSLAASDDISIHLSPQGPQKASSLIATQSKEAIMASSPKTSGSGRTQPKAPPPARLKSVSRSGSHVTTSGKQRSEYNLDMTKGKLGEAKEKCEMCEELRPMKAR